MLNVETVLPLETVSETVLLIEVHTPAAPSTDHTMNTDTTVTMPKAIDSRNDTFITDQGSIRLSRSRARRGDRDDVHRVLAAAPRRVEVTGTAAVCSGSARPWTGWTARGRGSAPGAGRGSGPGSRTASRT